MPLMVSVFAVFADIIFYHYFCFFIYVPKTVLTVGTLDDYGNDTDILHKILSVLSLFKDVVEVVDYRILYHHLLCVHLCL